MNNKEIIGEIELTELGRYNLKKINAMILGDYDNMTVKEFRETILKRCN